MGVGPVIRAVFLDRDGVLNQAVVREGKPYPPSDASAMRLTDGAGAALARLKALGYLLIVVTNQPDLARGTQLAANMEGIHESLRQQLPLDAFFVCPHDGPDHCACRKPKPGLIQQAQAEYGIELASSYLIGDRWRDIDAARAAAVRSIWIDYGYAERGPSAAPAATVKSLPEAVDWIVSQEGPR
ncbi:MAG: HAD-IIIA family hydrolase [Acidobacteria bacterium]|nr:HAD-IIIA family hydrolase [Acidobacteriota bacterium]